MLKDSLLQRVDAIDTDSSQKMQTLTSEGRIGDFNSSAMESLGTAVGSADATGLVVGRLEL